MWEWGVAGGGPWPCTALPPQLPQPPHCRHSHTPGSYSCPTKNQRSPHHQQLLVRHSAAPSHLLLSLSLLTDAAANPSSLPKTLTTLKCCIVFFFFSYSANSLWYFYVEAHNNALYKLLSISALNLHNKICVKFQ